MDFEEFRDAVLSRKWDELVVRDILDNFYHSGVPHVFQSDDKAHVQFKRKIANDIASEFGVRCDQSHIVVCGSGHLGFCSAPHKDIGRLFEFSRSDIDVAVLHEGLFDNWWHELVQPKNRRKGDRKRIAADLLNGFINPDAVRQATAIGRKWWHLFGGTGETPFDRVRGRIYRDPFFMQNYHRLSIIRCRHKLMGART